MKINLRKYRGFTLLELMAVLVIVSILAVVAAPLYTQYGNRARRADVKRVLMDLSRKMEEHRSTNQSYNGTHTASVPNTTFFPSQSPLQSSNKDYDLTMVTTSNTYTLTATPISSSDGGHQEGDGNLTLTHTGVRTWDGNSGWE